MRKEYDDIIHLPHHVSTKHPHMATTDRAAQFSPFAALTGHGAAIKETGRLTNEKVALEEYMKDILSDRLQIIADRLIEQLQIQITYFQPDEKKDGGAYITATGVVKKLDKYERIVVMMDKTEIPITDIISIEGNIFETMELGWYNE